MEFKKIAGFSGMLTGLIPLTIVLINAFFFKNFQLFSDFISVLGVKENDLMFNFGMILTGLIAIPFFLYLHEIFARKLVIAITLTVLSASLIGIGLFPMGSFLHNVFATLTFTFFFFLLFFFGLNAKTKNLKIVLFFLAGACLILLVLIGLFDFFRIPLTPAIETIYFFLMTLTSLGGGILVFLGKL